MTIHLNHSQGFYVLHGDRSEENQGRDENPWRSVGTEYEYETLQVKLDLFQGLTLRVVYRDVRVMSDVWEDQAFAQVWNPLSGRVEEYYLQYGDDATVDAPQEVQNLAQAWDQGNTLGRQFRDREQFHDAREATRRAERDHGTPVGRRVKVVRGRKVPRGTTGVVFWQGVDGYGKPKLGISPSGVKVGKVYPDALWTAAANCEPENPRDGFHFR